MSLSTSLPFLLHEGSSLDKNVGYPRERGRTFDKTNLHNFTINAKQVIKLSEPTVMSVNGIKLSQRQVVAQKKKAILSFLIQLSKAYLILTIYIP